MKEYEIEYSTHGHWYIVAESGEEAKRLFEEDVFMYSDLIEWDLDITGSSDTIE